MNLAVEKAAGARRNEGSHRSVHRQYVRMRVRRDNEASAPYRWIRENSDCLLTRALLAYRLWFHYPCAALPNSSARSKRVNGANLDVQSGEFLVIVGESGCGKTTTLRLIAGLETPDGGTIFIGGVPVNDVPVGKRNVQLIFQNYALWPHMTVFDEKSYTNLTLPLKGSQMDRRQDRRVSPAHRPAGRHRGEPV